MVLFNLSTSNEGINVSRVYGLSSFKVSPSYYPYILVTVPAKIQFNPLRCYSVSRPFQRASGRGEGGLERQVT